MSDIEPIAFPRGGASAAGATSAALASPGAISFSRSELSQILNVYGIHVASGEWRDYAIDMLRDKAVFSIFRRASEVPLFRIEKQPRLARRQGAWSVVAASGYIVKRGRSLEAVLRVFTPKPRLVDA